MKQNNSHAVVVESYFGVSILLDNTVPIITSIGHPDLGLSDDCQNKLQMVMDYHRSFLDKDHDGSPTRKGTVEEKKYFWRLQDDAIECLKAELDPDAFEIVEVRAPFPNPF